MKKIYLTAASALATITIMVFSANLSAQNANAAPPTSDVNLKRTTAAKISLEKNHMQAPVMAKAPKAAPSGGKKFRANVLWQDSWNDTGMQNGIYEFSIDSYDCQSVVIDRYIDGSGAAAYIDNGKYFWTSEDVFPAYGLTLVSHYLADTDTWEYTQESGSISGVARTLAWDHTTSTLFGCFKSETDNYVFGTFDPYDLTKERVAISTLSERWEALSVDKYGTLYAITASGKLCKVDKGTGRLSEIGDTGLTTKYLAGGAIDTDTNIFYFLPTQDTNAYLYAIDLTTAEATPLFVMENGEQLTGLWFPKEAGSAAVPAEISNLEIEVDHLSMTAEVTFKAPSKNTAGETQTGEITYSVLVGGETKAQGTTQWGASTGTILSFPEPGQYTISVTVSNSGGSSKDVYATVYVGTDCPASIAKVDLKCDNNLYSIAWEPVTESAHGGMFNPDEVKYDVIRYPGAIPVAEGISATSFSETLTDDHELMSVYYTVTPSFNVMAGNATKSNELLHGSALPPYSVRFDSRDALSFLTFDDVNDDGRYWMLYTDQNDEYCLYLYPTSMSNGDDYIFSAPLWLEPGSLYEVSAVMGSRYAQYGNKELIDLVVATAPSHNNVTKVLAQGILINEASQKASATFSVSEAGVYYVGIHGCSDPDSFGLFAYSMAVEKSSSENAPASPAIYAVASGSDPYDVTVKFTVPSEAINGQQLTAAPEKIELYRDSVLLKTYEKPEAASIIEYIDKNMSEGLYSYSAIAYNEDGAGQPGVAKVYAGINIPGAPVNVVATELDDLRSVTLTWDAPLTDRDGCTIDPDIITYTVANYNQNTMRWEPIASDLKERTYTHKAISSGDQTLLKFGVIAATSKGKNETEVGTAPTVAVGDPYAMPYIETFSGSLAGVLGEENENDASGWWAVSAAYDKDGTGNSIQYTGPIGKTGRMFTGKIMITGDNPVFSFWLYSIPTAGDEEILVEANDGTGYRQIGSVRLNHGGIEQHWEKYSVALDEFKGKAIQLRLSFVIDRYILNIDNLRVYNSYASNLAARSISATTHARPGDLIPVIAEIENTGEQKSGKATIAIYANDRELESLFVNPLEPDTKSSVVFEVALSACDPANSVLKAVILDEDDCVDDNASPAHELVLIHSDLAPATHLQALRTGEKTATLTWSKPEAGSEALRVTDGADNMVPFSTGFASSVLENDYIGDWTMIDVDRKGSLGLSGFAHPNIAENAELSFIVFNPGLLGITNSSWQPRSGKQMFVCLCAPAGANNDWMVSPKLSGKAQTVTFYAKSAGDSYNEVFEFLYSTDGMTTSDFKLVQQVSGVPASWTAYSFNVPAGAQYFAIRCVSERQFALFIDDITFERRNPSLDANLMGYKVYRDDNRITSSVILDNSYEDSNAPAAHSYKVTAVYDKGETAPSNIALIGEPTGLESPEADDSLISVSAGEGYIEISCPENLMIQLILPDGRIAYSKTSSGAVTRIDGLSTGVYLVQVGAESFRAAVK